MIEWTDEQLMVRDAMRKFVEREIKPNLVELEHGDMPPYDILRKMLSEFGMDQMARDRFKKTIEREKARPRPANGASSRRRRRNGRTATAVAA